MLIFLLKSLVTLKLLAFGLSYFQQNPVIQQLYKMLPQQPSEAFVKSIYERIESIRNLSKGVQLSIFEKIESFKADLPKNKKYLKHEKILNERMKMSENFIKAVSDTYFNMICDEQFIALTPSEKINEMFDDLTKAVNSSLSKILKNLEDEPKPIFQEDQEDEQVEPKDPNNSRDDPQKRKKKSKNFKIPSEATEPMQIWLLNNFETPYPSFSEKMEMAEKGGISIDKVNNWFLNARERTIKPYFNSRQRK